MILRHGWQPKGRFGSAQDTQWVPNGYLSSTPAAQGPGFFPGREDFLMPPFRLGHLRWLCEPPERSKAPAAGSSASYGKPHAQDGLVRVRAPLAAGPIHPVCVPAGLVAAPDLPARHRPYLAARRFRPGDRRFRPEVAQVAPGWRWDQARGSSILPF